MQASLEGIPQSGQVRIDISVTAQMNYTSYAARHKVNGFVLSEISYMLHAGEPVLQVGNRLRWRVPVILSLRSKGDIGEVGHIEVDVETGQLNVTPALIQEIDVRSEALAQRATSPTTE